MTREVMQQALEALDVVKLQYTQNRHINDAITAIKAALEQPEQEPVAFYHPRNGFYWAKLTSIFAPTAVDVPPVPLYVKWKAAQRPWVGLTDDEMSDIVADIDVDFGDLLWKVICLTKIIEAKLKELNK